MFKRFISYYGPHKKIFTLDMLASMGTSLIGVVYPIVTRTMLNDLIPNRQYRLIVIYGLALLLLYGVRWMLDYFIQYQGHMMGVFMQAEMRSDMFRHLQKLPFRFFDEHETGRIMSRLTHDLQDVTELAHHGPESLIICTISMVLSFVYLLTIDAWLSLIVFACVPALLMVSLYCRDKQKRAFTKSRQSLAVINASIESSVSGIRVTKAFTNAAEETAKFEEGNTLFKSAQREAYSAMAQFQSGTTFVTNIFNVVLLIAGGLFMYNGRINFADYSAFIVSVSLFLNPVNTLIRFMEQYQNGRAGFERFVEVMDLEPEQDAPDAVEIEHVKGEITFENVSYGYGDEADVLHHVDLSIHAGETFALVGPSGGGKTTICHLIPHFYELQEGTIRVDGLDITHVTRESLRRNIGIVQQDIYLFNASIRENILYGRPDATEEEVIEAAKRANIHEYILSMEKGYDTVIGERGIRLSGGQKQRLCIARVFLKNPPILILDEATSALDNTTEILIQEALDELCRGRTTIVVAHRLSTIKNADKIAVIAKGEIAEEGSHEELMALDGLYTQLYSQQFRSKLLTQV